MLKLSRTVDPYKDVYFRHKVKELAKQNAPIMGMSESEFIERLHDFAKLLVMRKGEKVE